MIELGVILAELSTILAKTDHNAFYAEFQRLQNEGFDARNIAQELMTFIQYDRRHPAYNRLKKVLSAEGVFSEEPTTDIRSRQTEPNPQEIERLRQEASADVDELLGINEDGRTTQPDVDTPSRHSAPTITNEIEIETREELEDFCDRPTFVPGEIPSDK